MREMLDALALELEDQIDSRWSVGAADDDDHILLVPKRPHNDHQHIRIWWVGSEVLINYYLSCEPQRYKVDMNDPDSLDELITRVTRLCIYKLDNEP